jgi:hypothetical protein
MKMSGVFGSLVLSTAGRDMRIGPMPNTRPATFFSKTNSSARVFSSGAAEFVGFDENVRGIWLFGPLDRWTRYENRTNAKHPSGHIFQQNEFLSTFIILIASKV